MERLLKKLGRIFLRWLENIGKGLMELFMEYIFIKRTSKSNNKVDHCYHEVCG